MIRLLILALAAAGLAGTVSFSDLDSIGRKAAADLVAQLKEWKKDPPAAAAAVREAIEGAGSEPQAQAIASAPAPAPLPSCGKLPAGQKPGAFRVVTPTGETHDVFKADGQQVGRCAG